MNEQQRPISPDGRWEWDGQQWVPHTISAPPRRPSGRWINVVALSILGFVGLLFVIGVAFTASHSPRAAVPAGVAASDQPVATPVTTPTPTSAPSPVTFSGTGSKVLTFDLPQGNYKLSWTAQGHDNFIVHLIGDQETGLVNEIPPNPSSGETLVRLGGGHYALNVQASTLAWTITLTVL